MPGEIQQQQCERCGGAFTRFYVVNFSTKERELVWQGCFHCAREEVRTFWLDQHAAREANAIVVTCFLRLGQRLMLDDADSPLSENFSLT